MLTLKSLRKPIVLETQTLGQKPLAVTLKYMSSVIQNNFNLLFHKEIQNIWLILQCNVTANKNIGFYNCYCILMLYVVLERFEELLETLRKT